MLFCQWGRPELETIELLLQYGADPTLADTQGRTALEMAAWCRDPAIARSMLRDHTFTAAQHRRAAAQAWSWGHRKTWWALL